VDLQRRLMVNNEMEGGKGGPECRQDDGKVGKGWQGWVGHAPDSTRESLVEDLDDNTDVGVGVARRKE
jgi:hypothetical protein